MEGNGSEEQIGRVAIWNGEIERCLHQTIIKARPTGNMLSDLLYTISVKDGRNQILRCFINFRFIHSVLTKLRIYKYQLVH